jgi:hypothetical protein
MIGQRRLLWFALLGCAIGAAMLHLRIHPPAKGTVYFWANFLCWMDLIGVSLLFLFRGTVVWGLLFNSFIAFVGIIVMADYSLTATLTGVIKVKPASDLLAWLLQTTFPDIAILLGDYMVGLALYRAKMGGFPSAS